MKTIYLDSDFICHVTDTGGLTPYITDEFDDFCDQFIGGFRLVPEGSVWTRNDGRVFRGLMISPAVQYNTIIQYQQQYEEDLDNMMSLEDVAELVEMVYQDDLEVIG